VPQDPLGRLNVVLDCTLVLPDRLLIVTHDHFTQVYLDFINEEFRSEILHRFPQFTGRRTESARRLILPANVHECFRVFAGLRNEQHVEFYSMDVNTNAVSHIGSLEVAEGTICAVHFHARLLYAVACNKSRITAIHTSSLLDGSKQRVNVEHKEEAS
jgi:hypothetical protein